MTDAGGGTITRRGLLHAASAATAVACIGAGIRSAPAGERLMRLVVLKETTGPIPAAWMEQAIGGMPERCRNGRILAICEAWPDPAGASRPVAMVEPRALDLLPFRSLAMLLAGPGPLRIAAAADPASAPSHGDRLHGNWSRIADLMEAAGACVALVAPRSDECRREILSSLAGSGFASGAPGRATAGAQLLACV